MSDHHENPYTHVPVEYRSDPMFPTVGLRWITTPSRYGPVFTAVSAIGTALLPAKPLPLRLWFQGIALLGGAGLCVLVWKRTRSPSALVFVALHPLMTLSVINGAHNDVFIPLAAFAGVMLVERKRFVKAGLVIAAGALVKATALFAIVAIVMWLLGQRRIRDAIITGASAVIPAVLGTLLVPGCVTAISSASDLNTNSSIWYVANLYFMRVSSFPIHGSDHSFHEVELLVKTPAMLATVLALIAGVVWLSRGARPSAMVVAAVSLSAFSVFAAWVMPWYLIWGLPLLAMWNGRLRTVAAIHGAVLLAVAHLHGIPRTHPNVWTVLFLIGVPIGAVVAYGIAIAHDARSGEEIQPSIPTG